jgi:hypothetical protein
MMHKADTVMHGHDKTDYHILDSVKVCFVKNNANVIS